MHLHERVIVKKVLAPITITDGTAQVGAIIDRAGYESIEFVLMTGVMADADATWSVLLEESNDSGMSGANAVADADLLGTEAAAGVTFADDGEVRKLGYKGTKRYLRLTIDDVTANTGSAPFAVCALLSNARREPMTQGDT